MQDKYVPFERVERPQDPPEPSPIHDPGYYNAFYDEFVPDDELFEYALENWDMRPMKERQEFKKWLTDWFYKDWKRIEGD